MDPKATLALMFQALKNGDCDALTEHMTNLSEWLNAGGFSPVVYWEGKPCDVILTYGDTELCVRTRIGTLRAVPMAQLSLYPGEGDSLGA